MFALFLYPSVRGPCRDAAEVTFVVVWWSTTRTFPSQESATTTSTIRSWLSRCLCGSCLISTAHLPRLSLPQRLVMRMRSFTTDQSASVRTLVIFSRLSSLTRQAFLITPLHGSHSKTGKNDYAKTVMLYYHM